MKYRDAVKAFKEKGIESAEYDAAVLFCTLLNIERSVLPIVADEDFESERLSAAVERRKEGYPLQYILGEWEFFGLSFEVNEKCLVPRPDTEILVEKAIKLLPQGAEFLELCTGSGCIPISICKSRHDVKGRATELYPETLEIARRNAERHGLNDIITFVQADLFAPCEAKIPDGKKYDAIISNPPYIPTDVVDVLEGEVRFEPRVALDGGGDGLDFYRVIISEYSKYLKDDGSIILEIGYDQAAAIIDLAKSGGLDCRVFKDFGGNDRVAVITKI